MERERETEGPVSVWINTVEKIVSFKPAPGFEERVYPSQEEMMAFVIEKGSSGYRIQ